MSAMPAASQAQSYVIQGREVRLPVIVRDAASGTATFAVSAAAARRLVPSPLEPIAIWPGRTLCSIGAIQYRDNDLGDYNEVSIAFFVRQRGAPRGIPYFGAIADFLRSRVAVFIRHLPVNQSFTCEAGRTIWGFPKSVQQIDIALTGERATCTLIMDGQHVLTLAVRRGGARHLPETAMTTYTFIDGVLHRTPFASAADGAGFSRGGAELTLGSHPIADELRGLGLPKRPLLTMWMEHMRGRFEAAEKI
jgi:hypothetical protein